jgi:hypothetical protein
LAIAATSLETSLALALKLWWHAAHDVSVFVLATVEVGAGGGGGGCTAVAVSVAAALAVVVALAVGVPVAGADAVVVGEAAGGVWPPPHATSDANEATSGTAATSASASSGRTWADGERMEGIFIEQQG